jgi:hypothetical protein
MKWKQCNKSKSKLDFPCLGRYYLAPQLTAQNNFNETGHSGHSTTITTDPASCKTGRPFQQIHKCRKIIKKIYMYIYIYIYIGGASQMVS